MNAHDLQYGIETVAPDTAVRNDGLRIGSYHHGTQVPYLPAGWTAENDGSINNGHGGHKCEIVSPVLKGGTGWAGPGRRGGPDSGEQRASRQRELRRPRPRRLAFHLLGPGPGPVDHYHGLPGKGAVRDYRHQEPRAKRLLRRREARFEMPTGSHKLPRPAEIVRPQEWGHLAQMGPNWITKPPMIMKANPTQVEGGTVSSKTSRPQRTLTMATNAT